MPVVVFVLSVAVFAQGTSEFMLSGLIEPIAADMGVSVAMAGLLTSLFAVGMIVGAPVMAMTAGRRPPRYSLSGFLILFIAAHVIGASTTSFGVLLATRVLAAIADSGFLAVTLAALPAVVGAERVGRATAIVLSGVTLACIAGVPAGAVLGQLAGWQAAFWAVVVVTAPALMATWLLVRTEPIVPQADSDATLRSEWRVLRRPPVGAWLVLGAVVNGATFAAFTYMAVIVTDIGDAGSGWVPVILAAFGIGSFLGVTSGSGVADRYPRLTVGLGGVALLIVWILTAITAAFLPALLVMSLVGGAVSFGVGSILIGLIVGTAAPHAPRLSGAFATMAFNSGAAIGPVLAGMAIGYGGTAIAAAWTSAAMIFAAIGFGAFAQFKWSLFDQPAEPEQVIR
ncbi:Cmx/CmrA family chloramphenicol efflux MFS transporter [Nocardia australiensis]|uniref:Cmx/CmrA family chloramphenicol efflux MFS transporter n=1 Tax=Nocardia australiensis TaxID=2887191 RepID=UPI001D13CE31|nr:Cmx/CmrA family chloramphenicol efflux MFS transporter [Nocardia australiensis]